MTAISTEQQLALRSATKNLQREFEGTFGTETIQLFLEQSYDQFARDARLPNYVTLFAERFARQRLKALAKVEGKEASTTPSVLFLCVHNAGRSQMAAGFLRHLGVDGVQVYSGGSEPASEVNAAAIDAMAEVGIDITTEFPKPWTDEIVRAADVVVTMGCGDACPLFPGKRYLDWVLDDPAGQSIEGVRPIRDDIEQRVRALMHELGVPARN